MRAAAENPKEILASTLNSLCWLIGYQTYSCVFAWTPGRRLLDYHLKF